MPQATTPPDITELFLRPWQHLFTHQEDIMGVMRTAPLTILALMILAAMGTWFVYWLVNKGKIYGLTATIAGLEREISFLERQKAELERQVAVISEQKPTIATQQQDAWTVPSGTIHDALCECIRRGHEILYLYREQKISDKPRREWMREVEIYLRSSLGQPYVIRWKNNDGIKVFSSLPEDIQERDQEMYADISFRVQRLEQFVKEIKNSM